MATVNETSMWRAHVGLYRLVSALAEMGQYGNAGILIITTRHENWVGTQGKVYAELFYGEVNRGVLPIERSVDAWLLSTASLLGL